MGFKMCKKLSKVDCNRSPVALLVPEIGTSEGDTLSVVEKKKEEQKKTDWDWSILVVGCWPVGSFKHLSFPLSSSLSKEISLYIFLHRITAYYMNTIFSVVKQPFWKPGAPY